MVDRKKVINCLTDIEQIMVCRQEICPREELQYWIELQEGVADAIALLKEQEAKTGHWIDTTNTIGFPRCECSECNSEAGAIWMKYCPNCGAKMEGR